MLATHTAFSEFDAAFSQAQTAFASGQYDVVLDRCEKALKLDKNATAVYALAGNACLVLSRPEKAEAYFRHALRLDNTAGERYFDLGNSLFGQQRLSEAMTHYAAAAQLGCSPEVMQKIYYLMGVISQLQGNNQAALLNYDKSASLRGANPDLEDMLLKRLQIYVQEKDFAGAENCAWQLKNMLPEEFQSYQLLFQIYLEEGKTANARKVLEEAKDNHLLENDPAAAIEWGFDLAMLSCFLAEQEPEQKTKHYKAALRYLDELERAQQLSAKDHCEVLITSAEIYMKLNDMEQAQRLAREAAEQKDASLAEYADRGCYILAKCGAARKDYRQMGLCAGRLKESQSMVHRHYAYYAQAYAVRAQAGDDPALQAKGERLYQEAIAYYKNCTVASPGDYSAYLYRAKLYVDRGDMERLEKISQVLPAQARQMLEAYIKEVRREES